MHLLRTYRCLPLLIVVVAVIFSSPLMSFGLILGMVWAFLLGFTGFLVYPTRTWLRTYIVLVLLQVLLLANHFTEGDPMWNRIASVIAALSINIAVFYVVMRHALFTKVNREFDRVVAAVTGYFILGLIWAKLYELVIIADAAAIRIGDSYIPEGSGDMVTYFSLVTLTTLGYGDIAPVNPFARLLATFESSVGTLYIAVVIASLIGRALARTRSDEA